MRELFQQSFDAATAESEQLRRESLERAALELRANDRDPGAYVGVARCYRSLGRREDELSTLQRGIARCPPSVELYRKTIHALDDLNRTQDAVALAREAGLKCPGELLFTFLEGLSLPILYADAAEIERYRRRFAEGIGRIARELRLDTPERRHSALDALGHHTNFLLAYQGRDDRELQAAYGAMACDIMAANYPHWAAPLAMPADDGRLRIGYVSPHLLNQSVAKTHLAWLTELNRDRFEVYAYHIGRKTDSWTADARRASAVFRHLPGSIDETCRAVIADRLHVLVFLDIGMDPRMTQLAALRLAPVQCTTWGHPMTSGLPTVEYFFSSELMEPADAQACYTEQIIRLPGVGVCYRKPVIPRPLFYKARADFGIRDNAVAYLSCQSPFKYLPQHDDVFTAIAAKVPNAQFVFIGQNEVVRGDFQRRLERSFADSGIESNGRLVFVPMQDQIGYWNLNALADVYLDTIEWSGCNSTFEAIACRLPVVTLPGTLMRGRHSYAILTQLGVTDTIARDKAEYAGIAARLGQDGEWRERVVGRMVDGYPRLFGDRRSIDALEDAFETIVREHLGRPPDRDR